MPSDEHPHFRMTAWPDFGRPFPLPRVHRLPPLYLSEKGPFLVVDDTPDSDFPVVVPEELLLRGLWDLDLSRERTVLDPSNPETIEDFVFAYGVLGAAGMPDLPDHWGMAVAKAQISLLRSSDYFESKTPLYDQWAVHLEEFRIHAKALRDMTRIWLLHIGLLSREDLQRDWELPIPQPESERDALYILVSFLNRGLRPFHTHLALFHLAPDGTPWEDGYIAKSAGQTPWGQPQAGTYNILCLQLFNHILEGIPPLRCANERCKRLFVKQQGRSEKGQHRTAGGRPKYCSAECARAQASRDLRKAKASALGLAQRGLRSSEIASRLNRDPRTIERWLTQPKRDRSKREQK